MAQASSAQREPTMEEILASIRRIIEDSDAGAKQANDSAPPVMSGTPALRQDPRLEVVSTLTEKANEGLQASRAPKSIDDDEFDLAAVRAVSDVLEREIPAQFSKRSGEEDSMNGDGHFGRGGRNERAGWASASQTATKQSHDRTEPPMQAPKQVSAPTLRHVQPAPIPEEQTVLHKEAPDAPAAAPEHKPFGEHVGSPQVNKDSMPRQDVARTDISNMLSEQAGKQIAAAFGELNVALETNRRRELDDMAKEMLRPMLQEWLDNNLPSMVEKLVRQEIERIARGER